MYHVHKLELMLNKPEKQIKCMIEKSFLGQTKMEYLGFWVTHYVIKTINRKIEEITNMKPPTLRK